MSNGKNNEDPNEEINLIFEAFGEEGGLQYINHLTELRMLRNSLVARGLVPDAEKSDKGIDSDE